MFELIIATHGNLANELSQTANIFMKSCSDIYTITLDNEGINAFSHKIDQLIKPILNKDTLVLTDLFGGTPFNEFAKKSFKWTGYFELMGGINLPILIEVLNLREQNLPLEDVIKHIKNMNSIKYFSDLNLQSISEEDE
ncbi:PTS fructose transporter subunit IIA [Bombilactobacillus bombi]|uniref:PTS sugar transporter subunit IIA n=1 Tax=Bombilactobacillus bombi TaxID=1303590 RepID=UPI000E5685F7|nr:PTS fructose transporter subunit IIA [Bombilactobacillus bombi]AXX65081.1 PTS fructose transporter subunit IIA [Bombilactobacillus bombi]